MTNAEVYTIQFLMLIASLSWVQVAQPFGVGVALALNVAMGAVLIIVQRRLLKRDTNNE